jgi:hypothetical protein
MEAVWKNAAKASLILLASQVIFQKLHPPSLFRRHQSMSSALSSMSSMNDPIFVMGLPRSGSEAIHKYMECLGLKSAHYCCRKDGRRATSTFPCPKDSFSCGDCILNNMKNNVNPLQNCGDYQIWSQFDIETSEPYSWFLPQHFTLPILHEAYPSATFLLPYRQDASTWAKSVLHWYSMTRRIFHAFDLDFYPTPIPPPPPETAKVTADGIVKDMQTAIDQRIFNSTELLRKEELLKQVYMNHAAKIRQWAHTYPTHTLVEFNIEQEEQATRILQSALLGLDDTASSRANKCKLQFNAKEYDNDWQDFSFSIPT